MPSRNIKLVLSYDGSLFSGWQIQPGRLTIQGTLSDAIQKICQEKVLPQGSGRTDAGVHALAQVASFQTSSSIPSDNLRKALNSNLPETIRIISVQDAPADFHARHSAKAKTYEYRMYRGDICPPFLANFVYHHPYPLDENAMLSAASLVVGEHDFTSFAAVDPDRTQSGTEASEAQSSNVRTIISSQWERRPAQFAGGDLSGYELVYSVRGNGFLHHMVRNLVGTFLMVGKGSLSADDIPRILAAKNRSAASATAPASGLYLVSVEY
ncbi:MAG: tRNA pseudouridine synthase [Acidobacteriales bacterium]|nr:tRNA pseudouridine synthase [Terriglobales bacterium]